MSQPDTPLGESSFDELFGYAVITGLTKVLGENGTQATIKHLGLGPYPADPKRIDAGLTAIFHKTGAEALERQIIQSISEKLNERFVEDGRLTFQQQVTTLKQRFGASRAR